ncbi:unnamed protein product [Pedinophyceae sp. YPF-701]|nr:unnamed protein product [Pedinophyceae sp. YPF-701]
MTKMIRVVVPRTVARPIKAQQAAQRRAMRGVSPRAASGPEGEELAKAPREISPKVVTGMMRSIEDEMDSLMREAFGAWSGRASPMHSALSLLGRAFPEAELPARRLEAAPAAWRIRFDIAETDEAYTLHADVPGLTKDDVSVEIEDNMLVVKGERQAQKAEEDKEGTWRLMERTHGSFERRFPLDPERVDIDAMEAKVAHGVLTIVVPKVPVQEPEKPAPKKIEVRGE